MTLLTCFAIGLAYELIGFIVGLVVIKYQCDRLERESEE